MSEIVKALQETSMLVSLKFTGLGINRVDKSASDKVVNARAPRRRA